jgi:Fe-S cluster biogenesis protein NfuA/nitrite reductase/ring-hydroxylating ferredoxin subunit
MNIFSQDDLNGVQEVIKKTNSAPGLLIRKEEPEVNEIAELNHQGERIQQIIEQIETLPDGKARDLVQECIREMLSFYGSGIERMLKIISGGNSTAAKDIYNDLIEDSFINGLLLIHDLHPLDLRTRLYKALDQVKPYMDSHGGSIELVSLEDGIAKLRLAGSCNGCASSSSTLELGVKQAIEENCPDLLGFEVEGIAGPSGKDFSSTQGEGGWRTVSGLSKLPEGSMLAVETDGVPAIVCRVDEKLYAYRNFCPACERSFSNGSLEKDLLICQLGHKFEVKRAGICTDDSTLHLDPFPLLEDAGIVKMAVNKKPGHA